MPSALMHEGSAGTVGWLNIRRNTAAPIQKVSGVDRITDGFLSTAMDARQAGLCHKPPLG